MCECLAPVRHACGSFGHLKYVRGGRDFYQCVRCATLFSVKCSLAGSDQATVLAVYPSLEAFWSRFEKEVR